MDFSGYSSFLHQENGPPQYNRNFVESGVKHHNLNPALQKNKTIKGKFLLCP